MTVSDTHHGPGTTTGPVNGKARFTVVHGQPELTPGTGVHEPEPALFVNPGPVPVPAAPEPGSVPAVDPARQVRLTPASAIRLRPTYWLWDERIPLGALVLGPGREGIGKSLFCAWLAAQVTHGTLPGVHYGQPRAVIYAATEDSWERTIAGRLFVAGADMDRVYRVEVESVTGTTLPLSLPRDCDDLADVIERAGVGLLVLDPLISAVDSRIDVNGEKLREALEPLGALADRTGCSIFGLAHFNKATGTDVLSRITGSRAFAAVARAVIAFARDTTADDGSCVLSQVKNNLGRLNLPSLRYRVDSVTLDTDEGPGQWGRLEFIGETNTHVDELLNDGTGNSGDREEQDEVTEWLRDYLTDAGGSALADDVYAAGRQAGYGKNKLRAAKADLGIGKPRKNGMRGGWFWHLPDDAAGQTEDTEGTRASSQVNAKVPEGAEGTGRP